MRKAALLAAILISSQAHAQGGLNLPGATPYGIAYAAPGSPNPKLAILGTSANRVMCTSSLGIPSMCTAIPSAVTIENITSATASTHTSQGGAIPINNHLLVIGDYGWLKSADISLYSKANITGSPVLGEQPGIRYTLSATNYDTRYTVQAATFTGTGSGTNLTVTGVSGTIQIGAAVTGTGVPGGTTISSQTSGTAGGAGVYVTNNATTSAGDALTATDTNLSIAYGLCAALRANSTLHAVLATVLDQQSQGMGNPVQSACSNQVVASPVGFAFSEPWVSGTTASALSTGGTTVSIVGGEAGSGTPKMDGGPVWQATREYPSGYTLSINDLGPYFNFQYRIGSAGYSQLSYLKNIWRSSTSNELRLGNLSGGSISDRLALGAGAYVMGASQLGDQGVDTFSVASMYATTYTNVAGADIKINVPTGRTGILQLAGSDVLSWNGGAVYPTTTLGATAGSLTNVFSTVFGRLFSTDAGAAGALQSGGTSIVGWNSAPAWFPSNNNTTLNGTDSNRWSNVKSVLGDFSGAVTIGGALTYGGVALSAAVTGTGNMVLSAGPTFTGTLAAATIAATAVISTGGYTVATLPAAPATGARAYVTDQNAACVATGAALTGGGGITCPVFFNGAAWVGG